MCLPDPFLCIGSIFSNDIASHYIAKDRLSDRQKVVLGRVFVVLIVVITYFLALKLKDRGVFQLAVWCFSGFASLFPLVFAAIYWKRVTKAGAYACVLTASVAWIYLFHQSGYGADREFLFLNMMPVATIIGLSTAALVLVSLVTRPPSRATIEKFFGSGTEDTASASARA